MNPNEVVKLARDLQGKSAAVVTEELRRRHCDPETRIAVRHQIEAQAIERRGLQAAGLATDGALAIGLSTDTALYDYTQRPLTEVQRLLTRAGFRLGQRYTPAEVDRLLGESGFDATQRIACRFELRDLAMTAAADQRPRLHASHGRTIEASSERPRGPLLVDRHGQPRVLRSYPE